jgi:hypothetical protein
MLRSWRERWDARRKGRRDGRAGVPALQNGGARIVFYGANLPRFPIQTPTASP